MRPSSDYSSSSSRELAQRSYNQALELEKQLRILIQAKGPFDPNVRAVRNNVRESYEAVILQDHEFSELHDVEQALWRLHYKGIEQFRSRIRKTMAAAGVTAPAQPAPSTGSRVTARKESLQKLLAFFKSYLSESTGFYHDLIMKIRREYGLPHEYASFQGELQWPVNEKGSPDLRRCQLSCHRCLIFLGDLARYKELHSDGSGHVRDWSVAAGCYLKAASLWPSSGNPHNQLAVLATYVGDELLAVYQYFRSLAVDSPFLTARENLVLLFEKNRQHYMKLSGLVSSTTPLSDVGISKASIKEKTSNGERIPSLHVKEPDTDLCSTPVTALETRKTFRIRFVRLNGILFTRTGLETFPDVFAATIRDLEQLLLNEDSSLEAGLGLDCRSGIGGGSGGAADAVRLVSILVFSVHNVNWGLDAHQPTYAEVLQRSALFQHAFTAAFECAGRLMQRCAQAKNVSASPLLPPVLIFLEWLACRPEMAVVSEMDEKQANARSFFWKEAVTLLNILSEKERGHDDLQGDYESDFSCHSNGIQDECGLALWEDFELRGFIPLVPAQLALDYSRQPSQAGSGEKEERKIRVQRILGAGKAVANALEWSRKGVCYDVDLEEFFVDGENQKRDKKQEPIGFSNMDAVAITSKGINTTPASIQWPHPSLGNGSAKAALEERQTQNAPNSKFFSGEEEEEELIVFKPVSTLNKPLPQSSQLDLLPENSLGTFNNRVVVGSSLHNPSAVVSYVKESIEGSKYNLSASQAPNESVVSAFTSSSDLEESRSRTGYVTSTNLALLSSVPVNRFSTGFNSSEHNTLMVSSELNSSKSTLPEINEMRSFIGPVGSISSAVDWANVLSGSSAYPSPITPWGVPSSPSIFANGPENLSTHAAMDWHPTQVVVGHSSWSSELESLARTGLAGLELSATSSGFIDKAVPKAGVGRSSTLSAVPGQVFEKENMPISSAEGPLTSSLPNQIYSSLSTTVNSNPLGSLGHDKIEGYTTLPSVWISQTSCSPILEAKAAGNNNLGITKSTPTGAGIYGSSSWNASNNSNGTWVRPVGIRPPPGFGPIPNAKPVTKVGGPRGSSQSPENVTVAEGEDQQVVDDYKWLDDDTPSKPTTSETGYQISSSLNPLGNGIWSNSVATSAAVAYPFPGMGSCHHRVQQCNLQQIQHQLLIQQQLDAQQLYLGIQQQQEQQHALLYQQQQQQKQQQQQQLSWFGQYRSQDPFVS